MYRKSDVLVGYVHLDEVEKEMEELVSRVQQKKSSHRTVATKILAYMVKGCTN